MCFSKTTLFPRIANEEIFTYKTGFKCKDDTFLSAILNFHYIPGKLYKTKNFFLNTLFKKELGGEGFHCFANIPLKPYHNCYDCVIPPGSLYYYNSMFGIYISNKLIIIGESVKI